METKLKEKFQSIQKSLDELAKGRDVSAASLEKSNENDYGNQEKII